MTRPTGQGASAAGRDRSRRRSGARQDKERKEPVRGIEPRAVIYCVTVAIGLTETARMVDRMGVEPICVTGKRKPLSTVTSAPMGRD